MFSELNNQGNLQLRKYAPSAPHAQATRTQEPQTLLMPGTPVQP